MPSAHVPMFDARGVFGVGPAARVGVSYQLPELPLYAEGGLGFLRSTGVDAEATLTTLGLTGGAGVSLPLAPRLRLRAGARLGYGQSSLDFEGSTAREGALGWSGVLGADIPLAGGLSIGIEAALTSYRNTYSAFHGGVGVSWAFGAAGRGAAGEGEVPDEATPQPLEEGTDAQAAPEEEAKAVPRTETVDYTTAELQLLEMGFDRVYPVFYSYYEENPVGGGTLKNASDEEISNVEVAVTIPRYTDVTQRQQVPTSLNPGEEARFDVEVLFNDELLSVTEGTKVAAEIAVSYTIDGEPQSYVVDTSLGVADRNAMTWDDDRKAASFVTSKDPAVLSFAKNVAGIVRSAGYGSLNDELRIGMAMLEALALHGIQYVVDPTTPYVELSEQPYAVDFLQFPRQTLSFRAGDCDDLSICYSSTMQAVGIKTAFITIPGHLYMAFSTGLSEREMRTTFDRHDDFIIHEGEAWVPVEVTLLQDGFLEAWRVGARQWREHSAREQAGFIPVEEAWNVYEPVGFEGGSASVERPASAQIRRAYTDTLSAFVEQEIRPQVARLESRIESSGGDPRYINRLGVLYARYGMADDARAEFERALDAGSGVNALVNLGNLAYLDDDYFTALDYYEQAQEKAPRNRAVLLGVARVHHELENYGFASRAYSSLEEVAPSLAARFEYLRFRGDESARASDVEQLQNTVIWAEQTEG